MTAPQDPFASPGDEPSRPQDPQSPPAGYGQPAYGQGPGSPPPGGFGGPAYGAPGGPGFGPSGSKSNGMAIASLVLGILSILTGFFIIGGLFGIIAIVLGILGLRKAKRGEAGSGGLALAGIVTGTIGLLLAILLIAIVGTLWSNEEFSNLRECMEAAGDDAAAIEECQQQFTDNFGSPAR